MTATIVLITSVLLQFIAAALALRLIGLTERKSAWLLMAIAIGLMGVRRSIVAFHLLSGDVAHPLDLIAELVGLVISMLMVVGVDRMAPFFRFAHRADEAVWEREQRLRLANQELEAKNQQLRATEQQLRAANQQLRATEQQLRATNQQLEATNQQLCATEQQARTVSAYSRSLIEASLDPLLTIDRDGRITDVNEATVQYTGVPRETLIGSDFSQYLTEPEKAVAGFLQVYSEGLLHDYPLTIQNADGQLWDVLCNASLYRDAIGNVQGVLAAARDITERKRAEVALRIKDIAVASASAGIAIAGMDGRINYVNPAWLRMFACDSDADVLGTTPVDYVRYPADFEAILNAVKQQCSWMGELECRRRDGSYFVAEVAGNVMTDSVGRPMGLLASFQDITARVVAEEKAKENNAINLSRLYLIEYSYSHSIDEFLEEVVNVAEKHTKSSIGFVHFVATDQQHLALQNWSTQTKATFCKAQGKGQHYAIDKAGVWVDCVHQRKPVIHNDYNALTHKKGMPEGHAHLERQMVVPVMTDGIIKAILGVGNKNADYTQEDVDVLSLIASLAWEIVERKTAREELSAYKDHLEELVEQRTQALTQSQAELLKAKEAAESVSHAKSAFLSNMSHEIRTPMNAILGFAQIIAHDPTLDQAHAVRIRSINRAGQHLLNLINDILDMAKIEAGVTRLNVSVTSLHDLLDDLLMMLRSRAEAKGLQLIMERDPSVPFHVLCDTAKLRQILVNLIGNAIKFTQAGGVVVRVCVEPSAGLVYRPASDSGGTVRLIVEVEDSGPGIPPDELDRVFTAFVQGRAGDSSGGTGLGLPISRRLAELMGGSLTVQSEVGSGSCFRVEVLLEPTEDLPETENRQPPCLVIGLAPGSGSRRILVVDDIRDNRDLLRDLLQSVGFEIREAHNGVEALAVFAEWSPHAVLMDMRMPVMDGYEATRRIKASEAGRDTPIIAVTASAFRESEAEILQTGVSAYLRKPFNTADIFDLLGRYLGLEYVYAAEPAKAPVRSGATELSPESLVALPPELRRAMREAVAVGDMAQFAELIGSAQTIDPAVATALRTLAKRYDYARLDELLAD